MVDKSLNYDPLDYYEKVLKESFKQNAEAYFDKLQQKAQVNIEENRATCKKINKEVANNKKSQQNLTNFNILRGFFIFFAVLAGVLFIVSTCLLFTDIYDNKMTFLIMLICSIVVLVGSIIFIFLYLNKKIKILKSIDDENKKRLQTYCDEAYGQLKYLNDLFNYYDFNNIVNETTDMFKLDKNLDPLKLLMVRKCYGLTSEPAQNESIVGVMSGNISTNPFIRIKVLENTMFNKVYTGTLLISWTESVSDGKGHTRLVTRTQTLSASVSKPAPNYGDATYLIYGNEAAPKLEFSRQPSGIKDNASENDINKFVRSKEKKLEKLTQKAVSKGGTFQTMANTEFETLFGAINRNNEVEYRLLFTPLAQQNIVEIITKSPYGDDFTFYKRKKINIISSLHGRTLFNFNEEGFRSIYSYDELKTKYINNMCDLFKSLYFELAPVLSIPLYQQTDAGIYDLKKDFAQHVSDYDAESMVNAMNRNIFLPEGASTEQILKVKYKNTIKNADFFNVTSKAFKTINRVDYVPVMGGDGRLHNVPVPWIEYIPVSRNSVVSIRHFNGKEEDFNNMNKSKDFINTYSLAFSSPTRFKNYLGFYDNGCYSYNEDYDDTLSEIVNRYSSNNN